MNKARPYSKVVHDTIGRAPVVRDARDEGDGADVGDLEGIEALDVAER